MCQVLFSGYKFFFLKDRFPHGTQNILDETEIRQKTTQITLEQQLQ